MSHKEIVLIGTRHKYQYGFGAKWGKVPCTQAEELAFRKLVRETALERRVRSLAEELNREALNAVGKTSSVLESLGSELQLPHLFCEPDRVERTQLGIERENDIRFSVFLSDEDEFEVQERLKEQFRKREHEWVRRLIVFDIWPALYVCGANHVSSFSEILTNAGVAVEVVHADWTT